MSFFASNSYSQYFPFPTDNAVWTNVERTLTFGQNGLPLWNISIVERFCANGIDTIIGPQVYKKINACSETSSNYHGALRYDIGKVFFVPKDSLNEFLLYDFSVNVGDTVNVIQRTHLWYPYYNTVDTYITGIDTIIVNGTPRRRIFGSGGSFNTWVEGIGSNAGLFLFFEENVSNYVFNLNCTSVNDTTVYDEFPLDVGLLGSCDLSVVIPEIDHNETWNLSPNPVIDGTIRINTTDIAELFDVKIYNTNGQELIHYTNLGNGENKINLEGLDTGMYYVHLISEKFHSIKQLVIL